MATKTISIDVEAYDRLTKVRRKNESFSQVIKRVVKPPFDFKAWLKQVEKLSIGEDAASAIETQIANRDRPSGREACDNGGS
jgi:predicted CopG family antitoxin